MSRVQLALNVSDLDASIAFYETVFSTAPHKRRPGYANFEIADPPLKLVLIETTPSERGTGVHGALNHVGVEMAEPSDVSAAIARLAASELSMTEEMDSTCCYATQDKVWLSDPAGVPWEIYAITDDAPAEASSDQPIESACGCGPGSCEPSTVSVATSA